MVVVRPLTAESRLDARQSEPRKLSVYAAASLKDAFTAIAHRFELANPKVKVQLNFAGSQALAAQINAGAPADVFASAAPKNLKGVAIRPESYRVFAHNRMMIAVRKGLAGIRSPRDLAKAERVVVAAPAVPVGGYTEAFFRSAGEAYGGYWLPAVRSHVVSQEEDVRAVLAKVRLGEADAGVVYASDVSTARGQVVGVAIPDEMNQIAEYPVAIVARSANRGDAKGFVKFLFTLASQHDLEADGFSSILRPSAALELSWSGGRESIRLPIPPKYGLAKQDATDEHGSTRHFEGVLLLRFLGGHPGSTVTFRAADAYAQTLPVSDLRHALLVRQSDGNYQLIVPGQPSSTWVNWLRKIELK